MSSRDRLAYLNFGRSPEPRPLDPPRGRPDPREQGTPRWLPDFERLLGGHLEAGAGGSRAVCRHAHALDEAYGAARLGSILDLSPRTLVSLGRDPGLGRIDLRGLVFVDCETTGLAGGTGTKAFLVGIAYFDDRGLTIEQHFLPDYDVEPAFLDGVSARLDQAAALVSFNGKCFDLPLLETRFALARLPINWQGLPHLDALFPARRLWKRRLASCALTALEEQILGVGRDDDVPGWLIPPIYFQYLRTGNLRPLQPVFEHNRRDLLSLVALTSLLGRLVDGVETASHALDLLSLGRYLEDLGETARSVSSYRQALSLDLPTPAQAEARIRLSLLLRRSGRGQEAAAEWETLARAHQPSALFALIELAKHHEHRTGDYGLAIEATKRALILTQLEAAGPDDDRAILAGLERRLFRLERRAGGSWRRRKTEGRLV